MHRRTLLTGGAALVAAAGTLHAHRAAARFVPIQEDDERFMALAIEEARAADDPYYFGAVIVRSGEVLARGHNSSARLADPTAHGEIMAIRNFLAARAPEALKGTTLYTSGEPCCMCMGAILWCGISRVVYAASVDELAKRMGQIMISSEDIAQRAPFATIDITGGVLAKEALSLFR
jgi:tRNA(Arg) A34 adenosine deaminase TadA